MTPPLEAASLEGLLVIVIIMALSAASNWLKRKQAEREGLPDFDETGRPVPPPPPLRPRAPGQPPPPPARPAPQPKPNPAAAWEEELRRLFEGEPEKPAEPPPRPVPPPPSRPTATPPPLVIDEEEGPRHGPVLVPRPLATVPASPHAPVRFPAERETLEQAEPPSFDLATMAESTSAYDRGQQSDDSARARVVASGLRTESAAPSAVIARHPRLTRDVDYVVTALRHPRTARQIMLASFILAPPKALER